MKILLVEDDRALRESLLQILQHGGYDVESVVDGRTADERLSAGAYDLVVLDLGLPELDGVEVLRRLRGRRDPTAVLVLTARDEVGDRVRGLDAGADDYLTKPFAVPEFEARVRALMRRGGIAPLLEFGPLRFDVESRRAQVGSTALDVTPREAVLLEALMRKPGQVVIKSRLAQRFSDWSESVGGNAIEVCVHRLRRKLEPCGVRIRTIHGLGYLIEAPGAADGGAG